MTIEISLLAGSAVLGIFQILLSTTVITRQRGIRWNLSSRGDVYPPPTGIAGRLQRAAENFKETFPFFIAAVMIVQVLAKNSPLTALGAQLYFWGRVFYVPLYAFDITHVRTLAWTAATAGIGLVLAGAFF